MIAENSYSDNGPSVLRFAPGCYTETLGKDVWRSWIEAIADIAVTAGIAVIAGIALIVWALFMP